MTLESLWVCQSATDEVVPFGCVGGRLILLAFRLPAAAAAAAAAAPCAT